MELQQRDGFEYDFDFSLMMDMDNNAVVAKGMGLVTLGMYIKKPDYKTIENILKSINDNATENSISPVRIGELQKQIISVCKELGGKTNTKLMETLEKYTPDKNPEHIDDESKLSELLVEVENLKKEKK